mgnify:CR=1 FL=1
MKNRMTVKSDTSENWAKAENFIPLKGEPIIYWDEDDSIKLKIGDGKTKINDLNFVYRKKSSVVDDILIL